MKGFIFAAGYGTRLRPLTDKIPKPLVPIGGIPAICFSLALLKKAGINNVICNSHYKSGMLADFLNSNNNFGMNIEISYEDEILGTAGGLKKCEESLSDGDFIILNSDIITDFDLKKLLDAHNRFKKNGTLLLFKNPIKEPAVSVSKNFVVDIYNNLGTNVSPEYDYAGISIFNKDIFQHLKIEFSSIVEKAFCPMSAEHSLAFIEHKGLLMDMGTLESYKNINKIINEKFANYMIEIKKTLGI